MQGIVAVGIEPEAMSETCFSCEVLFGNALEVVDKPAMCLIQLPEHIGKCQIPFLFCHLRIESIDAAVLDVSRWPLPFDDDWQIPQRLLFPCGHVRKYVFH